MSNMLLQTAYWAPIGGRIAVCYCFLLYRNYFGLEKLETVF